MEIATILLSALAGIITSFITAYLTTRSSVKQERIKWERELAQKLAEIGSGDSAKDRKTAKIVADRLTKQFAVGYLVFELKNSEREKVFIPPVGRIVVGRQDAASGWYPDIDLGSESVQNGISRKHAIFEVADSTVFVVDMNTTTGIIVNGKRVVGRQKLNDGDVIYLGRVKVTFHTLSR